MLEEMKRDGVWGLEHGVTVTLLEARVSGNWLRVSQKERAADTSLLSGVGLTAEGIA